MKYYLSGYGMKSPYSLISAYLARRNVIIPRRKEACHAEISILFLNPCRIIGTEGYSRKKDCLHDCRKHRKEGHTYE